MYKARSFGVYFESTYQTLGIRKKDFNGSTHVDSTVCQWNMDLQRSIGTVVYFLFYSNGVNPDVLQGNFVWKIVKDWWV